MSMTVALLDAPIPTEAARQAVLSHEIVVALVRAIAAGPHRGDAMLFLDDAQVGFDASYVSPQALELALDALAEPLATTAKTAVDSVLAFAKADGWDLSIRTNSDRHWMPGNAPEICLSLERSESVAASWSSGRVKAAFGRLGFALDADQSLRIPAQALAQACAGHEDEETLTLAEIAAYALKRGGANAEVFAA